MDLPQNFQAELQAQKLQALGQLAGGVAHDFNNILSIIEGYARMLDRQFEIGAPANPQEHDKAREKLKHILTATRRGAGLTRQLLAFGRQRIIANMACDLAALLRDMLILLHPLVTERIRVEMDLPDEEVMIPCDPDIMTQIVINLVVNARDAIPESGVIRITLTTTGDNIVMSVSDDGMGMNPEIATRIFEPFFTTKPQGQGTGLGLSMVAGYLQQIGSHIDLVSHPDSGTVFTLTFPRANIAQDKAEIPALSLLDQARAPIDMLARKTILVVDDEIALLPVLEEQLLNLGMKVLKAANAASAMVLQENYPDTIDLLLTDIVMPGTSGVKLAEMITRLRPQTGIVFMTGYPDRAESYMESPMGSERGSRPLPEDALILPKPLPMEALSPILQRALQRVKDMD